MSSKPKDTKKEHSGLVTTYLLAYNLISALGWAYIDILVLQHFFINKGTVDTLYSVVELPLKYIQTAALLEIVHAAIGFVRSSPVITFIQVASRVIVLWGIVHFSPPSQVHYTFTLMVSSWAAVEVPRYMWYVMELINSPIGALTYLRYSLFLVLYPTGISGEIGCLWNSLPHFTANPSQVNIDLPNKWNFVYNHVLVLTVLLYVAYPLGSFVMYQNMWNARKKKLFSTNNDSKKEK